MDLSLRSSPAILEGAMLSLIVQSLPSRSSSGVKDLPGMVCASELHCSAVLEYIAKHNES